MDTDEFTDTYSDDILYLNEARIALATHPMITNIPFLTDASFCRLFAIVMIGSIEAMLERWRDRDQLDIIKAYFSANIQNGARVKCLQDAFTSKGINIKQDVFDDYLAIKYLRNAIIHATWETQSGKAKQDQIEWIVARGFPADTRELTEKHWDKMQWVNENMMFYIALTTIQGTKPNPGMPTNIGLPKRVSSNTSGVILRSEWPTLYWSNLERISNIIERQIEAVSLIPEHSWAQGLSLDQINTMPHMERKARYYSAARAAAMNGYQPLLVLQDLAEDAIYSWSEYTRLVNDFQLLDPSTVRELVSTFRTMHDLAIYPKHGFFPAWAECLSSKVRDRIIAAAFDDLGPIRPEQLAQAHMLGTKAKRVIGNIMPLSLFSVYLPIIAPSCSRYYADTVNYIADVTEFGILWYSFVEHIAPPTDNIHFFRDMSQRFSKE